MDIDLLSKMVKELILDNDEVTLPGVGTFVTEIIPSSFSDKGYTINPPYRRLYFRQKQNDQDTKLSDFYALSNNIDKETAKIIIYDFLSEMKEILLRKRIIIFPGLGRLRATKENNLFFIADEDLDIYPEGFGLESISLKTHQETNEEVSQALDDLKSIISEQPEEETPATQPTVEVPVEQPIGENPVEEEPIRIIPEGYVPLEEVEKEEAAEKEQQKVPAEEGPAEEKATEEIPVEETVTEEAPVEESPLKEAPVEEIKVEEAPVEEVSEVKAEAAPVNTPEEEKKEEPAEVKTLETPVEKEKSIAADPKKKGLRAAVWVIIIVLVVCILALVAFIIVGHVAPQWIDKLLYSPEELQIINSIF